MLSFGQRLKMLRREADLSQSELADMIGVSVQSVSKWECDNNMPDVSLLLPLASVLNVTTDCLLGAGTDEKEDIKALHEELEKFYNMPFKPGHENHNYQAYLTEKEFLKKYPLNYEVKVDCAEWIYWYLDSSVRNYFEIKSEEFDSLWSEGVKMLTALKKQDSDPTHVSRIRSALIAFYTLKKMWDEAEGIALELPEKKYTKNDALYGIACEMKDYKKAEELSMKNISTDTLVYLNSAYERARRISIFGQKRKEEAITAWKEAIVAAESAEVFFKNDTETLLAVKFWRVELIKTLSGDYLALNNVENALDCVEKATDIGFEMYDLIDRLSEDSKYAKKKAEITGYVKRIPLNCYNSVIENDDNILSREERFKECQRRLDELE